MSTRSIIGTTPDGEKFGGVFCHWDGYPTGMVPGLAAIIIRDGESAVATLMRANWETIAPHTLRADTDLPYPTRQEYLDAVPWDQRDPGIWDLYQNLELYGDDCALHVVAGYGTTGGSGIATRPYYGKLSTFRTRDWTEWAYIITADLSLRVFEVSENGSLMPRETFTLDDLADIAAGDEDARGRVGRAECGADYSRCSHYAWAHESVPPESRNLSMREWLGLEPILPSSAIAGTVDGVRYEFTSGGSLRGSTWYMFTKDGTRVGVLRRDRRGKETPLPGVSLVYPPTKAQVAATVGV